MARVWHRGRSLFPCFLLSRGKVLRERRIAARNSTNSGPKLVRAGSRHLGPLFSAAWSERRSSIVLLVKGLLTADQVATRLRRNPELIRRWIREGRLKADKLGPTWVVTLSELARFRREQPERRRR
jgi:hypothetical protein